MNFLIADSFTDALARLPAAEQKAAKVSALDLQLDPTSPGLQFHRIDKSKDPNFWSIRVNRDIRIIVHKTAASMLLVYVDHHDKAYAWAERRRIETHPKTGAVQIVEVRERVEEATPSLFVAPPVPIEAAPTPILLFANLTPDELLSIGTPPDWIEAISGATEEQFFELALHLPAEASEALLGFAADGVLRKPEPVAIAADPFEHPDARRRFRVIENQEELAAALDAPWDKWSIFLHPSQREVVERTYTGPARAAGSAGTGKTVVAVHRAVRLAKRDAKSRVLLTTFSEPLADSLRQKVTVLAGGDAGLVGRITVAPWNGLADELHQLAFGRRPRIATDAQVGAALGSAAESLGVTEFSARFLLTEFNCVIDAWQVESAEAYADTPRLGRKSRLGAKQRERLWPIFEEAHRALSRSGVTTLPTVFGELAARWRVRDEKPFAHIVVDEAQDLGVPELRFLAALAPSGPDAVFFAGDLGQRIFQQPFSWRSLGVDLRGRSTTLKVNYRTSHQIRQAADRLLPDVSRDVDGEEQRRAGTISIFDGPQPEVRRCSTPDDEQAAVAGWIKAAVDDGVRPSEIGLFVRSTDQMQRAWLAVRAAGFASREVKDRVADEALTIGTMRLAKGLEFKAVAVMACDASAIPDEARIAAAVDETELDEVYATERQLFYVACTRARDRLLITGVDPASEYLNDLD